jgi:hypothetical protein
MPKATVTTKPMTQWSQRAARLCFVTSAVFVVLLAALHALKSNLDPSWHFISEYEIGRHGWMMRLAFLSLALSCAALITAVFSQIRTIGGYLGLVLLAVSAVGMTIAGIFVSDPIDAVGEAKTSAGKLHELGAMLDLVPFAALLINWSLARNQAWSSVRRTLFWTGGLPLIGTVVFVACMTMMLAKHGGKLGPDVLIGWPNRIMILAHCAWLMAIAHCAIKVSRLANGVAPLRQNTGPGK